MANALTKVKSGAVHADTVGLAEMAGLARGKLIYGDSSGDPAALAVGSNGTYLKSDGTDISWASVSAGTTLSGSTDNQLTTVTGANAIQGEANLTYDGNNLQHSIDSPGEGIRIKATGDHWTGFYGNANRSSADTWLVNLTGQWNGTSVGHIAVLAGADTTNKDDGRIAFYTSASDGNDPVERMRIDENGKIGIGTTSPDAPLTIHNSSDPEIRFGYSSSQDHRIGWDSSNVHIHADPEDGNANSSIRLYVDGSETVRINDGSVIVDGTDASGAHSNNQNFVVGNTSQSITGMSLVTQSGGYCSIVMSDGQGDKNKGLIGYNHADDTMKICNDPATGSDGLVLQSNNDVKIATGNLVIGTAGKGIDFSNQTATSTGSVDSTGEILDHYEEGSWTPSIDGLSNTPTYHNKVGKYTRIGNIVKCQGFIQIANTKPTFSNTQAVFNISGLPFTSQGVGYNQVIGNVCWSQIDWVGSSRSTYGHDDDTQLTVGIVSSTKCEFKTMGQAKYYMGQLKNIVFHDDGSWILEWDMTYYVAT